jgi:hypothetical protein
MARNERLDRSSRTATYDGAGLGDQHLSDRVALDVHAEDVTGHPRSVRGIGRQLHAACLAPAAGLDLGFDHDTSADLLSSRSRLLGGADHVIPPPGYAVLGEQFVCLMLKQIH